MVVFLSRSFMQTKASQRWTNQTLENAPSRTPYEKMKLQNAVLQQFSFLTNNPISIFIKFFFRKFLKRSTLILRCFPVYCNLNVNRIMIFIVYYFRLNFRIQIMFYCNFSHCICFCCKYKQK